MAHAGGRPPYYKTAKELQKKINRYFSSGYAAKRYTTRKVISADGTTTEVPTPTITGLILFLGFCDRQSFYDLENQEKFATTIKRARTMIEAEYEKLLHAGQCTGAIFALKNFGWTDKTEIEQTSNVKIMGTISRNGVPLEFSIGGQLPLPPPSRAINEPE